MSDNQLLEEGQILNFPQNVQSLIDEYILTNHGGEKESQKDNKDSSSNL